MINPNEEEYHHLKSINLEHLFTFAILFESNQDLHETAKKLGGTADSIRRQLRKLERAIEVPLFERPGDEEKNRDYSKLTRAGQTLLASSAVFLLSVFDIERRVRVAHHRDAILRKNPDPVTA